MAARVTAPGTAPCTSRRSAPRRCARRRARRDRRASSPLPSAGAPSADHRRDAVETTSHAWARLRPHGEEPSCAPSPRPSALGTRGSDLGSQAGLASDQRSAPCAPGLAQPARGRSADRRSTGRATGRSCWISSSALWIPHIFPVSVSQGERTRARRLRAARRSDVRHLGALPSALRIPHIFPGVREPGRAHASPPSKGSPSKITCGPLALCPSTRRLRRRLRATGKGERFRSQEDL